MKAAANDEAIRIGKKIVSARKRKGMSQVELATRLGASLDREPESVRRTLINNERGRNVPRISFLRAIAEATGQPLDYFFRPGADDGASGPGSVDGSVAPDDRGKRRGRAGGAKVRRAA